MTQRLQYLDSTKGFAIFLMVLAHAIAWQFEDYRDVVLLRDNMTISTLNAGFIWQFIYSFHMPLFFFVSGFLLFKPEMTMGGAINGLKRRTIRLLIPYFTTGFLITLIRPGFGYWFLFSLWELSVIGLLLQYLLYKINKKNYIIMDLAIIFIVWRLLSQALTQKALLNPVVDFGYGISFFLPFVTGWLINKYRKLDDFLSNHYSVVMISFIILFSLRYIHVNGIVYCYFDKIVKYVNLVPILGSLTFFYLFRQGVTEKLQDCFVWLGQQTFEIYILHVFFVMRLTEVGDFWLRTNLPTCLATQLIYSSVVSAVSIGISILLARFIKHSGVLSKLVFGQ